MKDNCYVYVIDLSLRKGKIGQYSEALVFECQPFLSSNLGGNSKWSYKKAFSKAFPHSHMKIDVQGNLTHVVSHEPSHRILIKDSERVSTNDFVKISQGNYYKHVHTGSFEIEIDKLNNKVLQRLYLPDEVSPEYRILQLNTAPEELIADISMYFSVKGISKIVLKSAISHEGKGNLFIDIKDKEALKQGIKQMRKLNANTKYFLAEEQKEFPRVSRKTEEQKSGHLTYRLVGIANPEGDLGHFIASKSIPDSIDSHQRVKMKCYFDQPGKTHDRKSGWSLEACGPKDKYFGLGENKVDIDPALMDKLSKRMYQLYADIKSMSEEEFAQHFDSLVAYKNTLLSREEKINQFTIEEKKENELVNTPNLRAYTIAATAHPPLANSIASEMIKTNTVELSMLEKLRYYNNNDIEPFLNAMRNQNQFAGLKTASTEQLNYCIQEYGFDMKITRRAKQLLTKRESINPGKQAAPISPQAGPSDYKWHKVFFPNHPGQSATEITENSSSGLAASNNSPITTSRLSGSTLFSMIQSDTAQAKKDKEKQKKRDYAK
jgi:hypothetical protein